MKKIIMMLMSVIVIFSLCACNNEEVTNEKVDMPITDSKNNIDLIEDSTVGVSGSNEIKNDVENNIDKQSLWEQVFANKAYVLDPTSTRSIIGDVVQMEMLQDSEGKVLCKVSANGEDETYASASLYLADEEHLYYMEELRNNNETKITWKKCIKDDESKPFLYDSRELEIVGIENAFENNNKIEYIKTIDDKDYLKLYYNASVLDDDADENLVYSLDIVIDSKTYHVDRVVMLDGVENKEDMKYDTEFILQKDVIIDVKVPEAITETISESDASNEFGFMLLGLMYQ